MSVEEGTSDLVEDDKELKNKDSCSGLLENNTNEDDIWGEGKSSESTRKGLDKEVVG